VRCGVIATQLTVDSTTTTWTSFGRHELNLLFFFIRGAEVGCLFGHYLVESARRKGRLAPRPSPPVHAGRQPSRRDGGVESGMTPPSL
jgi:hypothetical protein